MAEVEGGLIDSLISGGGPEFELAALNAAGEAAKLISCDIRGEAASIRRVTLPHWARSAELRTVATQRNELKKIKYLSQ